MLVKILQGDCREVLPAMEAQSVQCCVTSPPYWGLRDYSISGQLGLESTPEEYVTNMVGVFREVKRVLRDDGSLWLNLGDSYAGSSMNGGGKESSTLVGTHHEDRNGCRFNGAKKDFGSLKPKDLCGIPWRVAFALQADGWYLRSDIIWAKPNPMPESVTDRPTKAHEYLFLLTKQERYFYDCTAIREPSARPGEVGDIGGEKGRNRVIPPTDPGFRNGNDHWGRTMETNAMRNKRSVWTIATQPYSDTTLNFDEADYVGSDGKPYKASADCPIHARLANRRIEQKVSGDAQLDLVTLRNLGSDARRDVGLIVSSGAMLLKNNETTSVENVREQNHGSTNENKKRISEIGEHDQAYGAESLFHTNHKLSLSTLQGDSQGCSVPDSSHSAISNSTEIRKMDRARGTTEPYNASVQKSDYTFDKSKLPENYELFGHMPENNTLQGDSGDLPLVQKASGILNKASFRDLVCQCKECSQSHFATFPEDLIKPCILAGSRPGDMILDPFAGSGTVGKVAIELARKSILIELSNPYCEMAKRRVDVTPAML